MDNHELNLASLSQLSSDESKAREFLESRLWPNGPVCPHCKATTAYKLTAKPGSKKPVRAGVYKCKECRKQFTVRVGTIFEDSHIPLCKWLMALHLMTSSKKGVSSLQLSRELGVTIKSAWFLSHRIREAMRDSGPGGLLTGTVECDEVYMGGKPRKKSFEKSKRGRGTKKTPVMVLVERDGAARTKVLGRITGKALRGEICVRVAKEAIIMTDEFSSYCGVRKTHARHETVTHSIQEYAKTTHDGLRVHVNTAESFNALLKRGHYGIFHMLSKKHLHRYCDEFSFRWNHRKVTDGERMVAAIRGAEGKRLMYHQAS